jgi:hypothetical protein
MNACPNKKPRWSARLGESDTNDDEQLPINGHTGTTGAYALVGGEVEHIGVLLHRAAL